MEILCRFGEIMALRVLISWTSATLHIVLSPDPHRMGHSRDATQPSIEPTGVTAGHTSKRT